MSPKQLELAGTPCEASQRQARGAGSIPPFTHAAGGAEMPAPMCLQQQPHGSFRQTRIRVATMESASKYLEKPKHSVLFS